MSIRKIANIQLIAEDLYNKSQSGELKALLVMYTDKDDQFSSAWTSEDAVTFLGQIEFLKHDIVLRASTQNKV